jgi:beta-glucanase (GH16 family)
MRYTILFILLSFVSKSFSQNCLTEEYFYPVVTPVTSDIAIPTMGWTKNNSLSIEFNTGSLTGDWYFWDGYVHPHTDNHFSNDNYYWSLTGGELTLKLFDIPNGIYDYTTAILCNDNIDQQYGYFEVRVKLPIDEGLCTSFWGFEGLHNNPSYREIDVFEFFSQSLKTNEYHEISGGDGYGGIMYSDPDIIDETEWYIFGYEWLPNEYTLYINNHFIGRFNTDTDCVKEDLQEMSFWRFWIVNWKYSSDPTGTFPKTLTADYIRFYSLDLTNISNDFYDYLYDYDYGVWKTVHLGDTYSSDAKFNDNGKHAIRSTDGFTLGSGFEVALGTEFETIIYKP